MIYTISVTSQTLCKHFLAGGKIVWLSNSETTFCSYVFVKMLVNTTIIAGDRKESDTKDLRVQQANNLLILSGWQ